MERVESRRRFRKWLANSSKSLLITGAPYTGKTVFAKQIESDAQLAASHYCSRLYPESLETATLLKNIANQLICRFPNLVVPNLATITLISQQEEALEHFIVRPLLSLPRPKLPLFLLIDGIEKSLLPLLLQMSRTFPKWLKLVATSRPLDFEERKLLEKFHFYELDSDPSELISFIEYRLPQIDVNLIIEASHGSWFYIDQYSRALQAGLLPAASTSHSEDDLLMLHSADPSLCYGHDELLSAIEQQLPPHLNFYLQLITSSRQPPARSEFLAAAKLAVGGTVSSLEADLSDCEVILDCVDPVILSGAWRDRVACDVKEGHALWAEVIRRTGCDSAQTLIELAYHLAHSGEEYSPNRVEILRSFGADLIEMRCPVFDFETSQLLHEAGALVLDYRLQPDFVFACSSGDQKMVDELLKNVEEGALASGLIAAASRGNMGICRAILERNASASRYCDSQQWNALRAAACNNHIDVLDLLIEYGTDVDECGHGGRTALRAAAWSGHEAVVLRLVQSGADLDKRDAEGRTALMAAAFMDHFNIVAILLQFGASPNLIDTSGATALHLVLANSAHSEEHDKTVHELIKGGSDVNIEDANGRNCVHIAAYHGDDNLQLISSLCKNIDFQDGNGRTALMLAACQGELRTCQKLVELGADIDCIDNHGRTALILAAIHANVDICRMLMSLGADEGHKDNDGAVALHYAAAHPDAELCKVLCTPTTIKTTDNHGNHPLLVASQHPSVEVVSELLRCGAPIHLQSHDGQSALRIAALARHENVTRCIAEFLLSNGGPSDLEQQDLEGTPLLHTLIIAHDLLIASLLLHLGASTSVRDAHARTCAHVVAQVNDVSMAKLIKEFGANFDSRDEAGRTPLMTAVWSSNYEIAHFMLEAVGVPPNAVDFQGATALNIAAQIGHRDLVVLLLKFGSEPSLCDNLGRNAADVAHLAGHEQIMQILKSASGSADSSGFGSLPTSPTDQRTKSLTRRSGIATNPKFLQSPKAGQRVVS